MTILYAGPPKAKRRDQDSAKEHLYWKFPDLDALEELEDLQAEERSYVEVIERSGGAGRVLDFLKARVDAREQQIKELRANGRFP
jgi:hypothetical protein